MECRFQLVRASPERAALDERRLPVQLALAAARIVGLARDPIEQHCLAARPRIPVLFAVNVSITAALVALLVPPSHNLTLFAAAAGGGLSIADLFAAGIVPALLMTVALMVTGYVVARRRGYGVEVLPGWRAVLRAWSWPCPAWAWSR